MPFSIAAVEIRPDVLTLAGCEVQKLEEGRVREQDLRAGVMLQLYDRLEEVREATERYSAAGCAPWHSEVDDPETGARLLIVIDPGASTATLAHVVHTAAEAGYREVHYLVDADSVRVSRSTPHPLTELRWHPADPTPAGATLALRGGGSGAGVTEARAITIGSQLTVLIESLPDVSEEPPPASESPPASRPQSRSKAPAPTPVEVTERQVGETPLGLVRRSELSSTGPVDPEAIAVVLDASHDVFAFCYQKALAKDPDLAGTANITFVITPNGGAGQARVEETTLGDAAAGHCITNRIVRLAFPPHGGTEPVEVAVRYEMLSE